MIDLSALIQNIGNFLFGTAPSNQPSNKTRKNNQPPITATGAITKQYTLNYFDPAENSNKVWTGIAYDTGLFETQFGRVRDGKNLAKKQKQFRSKVEAEHELDKKRREKLRKGYKDTVVLDNHVETTIKKDKQDELSRLATEQIGGAAEDSVTAELIKYLVEVNIHHITHATNIKYNAKNATFSTPLGILTPEAIGEARDFLNEIKTFNDAEEADDSARAKRVRDYFQLVPKDFGMKIPPVSELLATDEQIEEQVSILEALESAITIDTPQTSHKKFFQCRLIKIPHYTDEGRKLFREVRGLYEKTRNAKYHPGVAKLKLTRLYEVEIESMKANFEATAKKIGNVQQDLWHGTKASNLLSILKNGLIIPPANASHCTGRMFGNGIYTSLQSTKALNYATNYWNQSGQADQRTFMFLCEAALGKTYKPTIFSNKTYPASGTDSTWVKPGIAGVINHECIVYDPAQINLKYLAEFDTE
jgi:poly [ADP-ribose] polymerase 2/3/4